MSPVDGPTASPSDRNDDDGASTPVAPVVTLPKGGGAIRGIGEKFAANPVTGTGTMSVPIPSSPGRDGFGPDLALSYDSGASAGPFGFGWSLRLASVTRKTDKGLPRYRDAEESDVFLMSGAEDLVPVLKASGDRFEDHTTVHGYTIHRYRPRIEGTFARIERWTRDDGDVHWRSISGDNILSIYGRDEESRIADPADPGRVFSWLVCEVRDHKGNAIVYTYKPEDGADADLGNVHQRHRGDRADPARSANRYVKRIRYGNRVSLLDVQGRRLRTLTPQQIDGAGWMFEVVFDYGEHGADVLEPDDAGEHDTDVPWPDEAREWDHRADAFSSYRPGFEVRTARLCRRVLMFHHFPEEDGVGDACLVTSTRFDYGDTNAGPATVSEPVYAYLRSVTQSGHVRDGAGYIKRRLPPLEFDYTRARIDGVIHDVEEVDDLPGGVDGANSEWVDLRGDGVAGIVTELDDGWLFKRNLSPLHDNQAVEFGPWSPVSVKPNVSLAGGARFMDLAGDGQLDVVTLDGPTPGWYEQGAGEEWQPFRAFESRLGCDSSGPNARLVDLTGDGLADMLITEADGFVWYESLGEHGFGPAVRVSRDVDEERGPALVFADGTQSIYLADMSGDGLSDLVRIRDGGVCYWPNLGYGRFGAKVTMDNPPYFDHPDRFSHDRIRLADIDGTGTADIIYLHPDAVRIYFNQSGNCWSTAHELLLFPPVDNIVHVSVTDLVGNGTSCLVWSSPLPADQGRQLRYVDLMGGQKPHLLVSTVNNLGAETRVRYASSTRFRLNDEREGRPWITRLAFPVHVVERVEVHDRLSRNRFVTKYAYHHGYYDGYEREFRGFAMVEQWDTETIAELANSPDFPVGDNVDAASHVPPVLIRSWFHTGVYLGRDHISDLFAGTIDERDRGEYWREPGLTNPQAQTLLLDDTVLPAGLNTGEEREACRALKGILLRREVYARDDSNKAEHPYTVTEQNLTILRLQARGDARHGVFLTHPRESLTYHYERNPSDPRVRHTLVLEADEYGNVLKQAEISYGRRRPDPALPLQADGDVQTRRLVTFTEHTPTAAVDDTDDVDNYRTPILCETRKYQLTDYPATGPDGRFTAEDLVEPDPADPRRLRPLVDETLSYEEEPTACRQRRLIGHTRTLYRSDKLTRLLPFGQLESRALPGETYSLALTAGLLAGTYVRDGQPLLPNRAAVLAGGGPDRGGYASGDALAAAGLFPPGDPAGQWWKPTGRVFFSPGRRDSAAAELATAQAHFFLPRRFRDPFDGAASTENTITYDTHDLLPLETRDAVGNRVTAGERRQNGAIDPAVAGNDYRVLKPRLVTDPNGNRAQAAFDSLGMVVGTAVMGKRGERRGDSLQGFVADLDEARMLDYLDHLDHGDHASTDPPNLLGRATTRLVYDLFAYHRTKGRPHPQPAVVHTIARETHDSELADGEVTKVQLSFSYSDGLGREIQKKVQAEPGPGPVRDAAGRIVAVSGRPRMTNASIFPRWVGSGWTEFNNKGKPVRQYEPFFSDTHLCDLDARIGVAKALFYDPVERVVAVLHPNHTYEKVVFDPWHMSSYDVNDTTEAHGQQTGDPRTDPDIAPFVERHFEQEDPNWQTWLAQRQGAGVSPDEADAATKATAHADTPTTTYLDPLGRTFLTRAHSGFTRGGNRILFDTHVVLDIEGNPRAVIDAEGRTAMTYDYDMLGNRTHQSSMEAGERWTLNDVAGNPIRAWDSRGHDFRSEYDALRRPERHFVEGSGPTSDPDTRGGPVLYERTEYGEGQPTEAADNLRGRVFRQFDAAGSVTHRYDFKGNVTSQVREVSTDFKRAIDWAAAQPPGERFEAATWYDALNRPIQLVAPHVDDAAAKRNVVQPMYNEANLLEQLRVWTGLAADPDGLLDHAAEPPSDVVGVDGIDYNAKGQRTRITYRNGVTTTYEYDLETFRLIHLYTRRGRAFTDDCGGNPPAPRTAAPDSPLVGKPCGLQNLHYTYDPAGNITRIRDDAQQTVFFRNQIVDASHDYTYDPVYRLVQALGREHVGQAGGAGIPHDYNAARRTGLPHPGDGNAMGRYCETYHYDRAGNIRDMRHGRTCPGTDSWKRTLTYEEATHLDDRDSSGTLRRSNRLTASTVAGETETFSVNGNGYDPHGNMLRMAQLQELAWNFQDRLHMSRRQAINQADAEGTSRHGERTHYVYDAGGQRVRKVTETAAGALKDERLYLGGFEIYRKHSGQYAGLLRETLHIMDDQQRIALVETRNDVDDGTLVAVIRYQLGNHLGSAVLEVDEQQRIITYEEYAPYGSTTYQAVRTDVEVAAKRYQYVGKERDEETSLLYHGARYYAPWLGRWTACDPIGMADGPNLYCFVQGNPIRLRDQRGLAAEDAQASLNRLLERTKAAREGNKTGWENVLGPIPGVGANYMSMPGAPHREQIVDTKQTLQAAQVATEVSFMFLPGPGIIPRIAKVAEGTGVTAIVAGATLRGLGILGKAQLAIGIKEAVTGTSITGRPLSTKERVSTAIQTGIGLVGALTATGRRLLERPPKGPQVATHPTQGEAASLLHSDAPKSTQRPTTISTPYESVTQEGSSAATSARDQVEAGRTIYRRGYTGTADSETAQLTSEAQYWSLTNPATTANYEGIHGMPPTGTAAGGSYPWIGAASLKPGAAVVTRSSPGMGANPGGAMEAVIPPSSVKWEWFHMP